MAGLGYICASVCMHVCAHMFDDWGPRTGSGELSVTPSDLGKAQR